MSSVAAPYKVHIKLGQAEFSAEGPEETVKTQLASFLAVAPNYAEHGNGNGHANGKAVAVNGNGTNGVNGNGHAELQPTGAWQTCLESSLIKRLFAEGKDGLISLRVLPNTEEKKSDAIFLILFGYLILKDQSEVKAGELLIAARQSGLTLSRIDDTMDKFDVLVTRGGIKRGSRYALTNPGIEYAESVAAKMFG
jgi:hypothetical protein